MGKMALQLMEFYDFFFKSIDIKNIEFMPGVYTRIK